MQSTSKAMAVLWLAACTASVGAQEQTDLLQTIESRMIDMRLLERCEDIGIMTPDAIHNSLTTEFLSLRQDVADEEIIDRWELTGQATKTYYSQPGMDLSFFCTSAHSRLAKRYGAEAMDLQLR